MTESFRAGGPDWKDRHLDAYLKTGGKIGHLVDFSPQGGAETPCLILQTTPQEGGKPQLVPLIYAKDGQDFVVIVAEDDASDPPAWFLDLKANPQIKFQVLEAKYSGQAKPAPEEARQRLFEMVAKIHQPYAEQQKQTEQAFPVVILHPEVSIDRL